jgi:nucleoside-diphosphate-sugar epimerase
VRRFVHGSSIGVYGWKPGRVVGDDSPLEPDNIYGVTKLAGEKVVREYEGRLDWVILRIAETYGPGDRRLLKFFRGVKKGRFPVIGRGDNLHHLVYIDDLLDGCLLAATVDAAVGGVFVLAGDKAITTREMLDTVARLYRTSPPRLRLPLGPMLFAATLMQGVLRPLGIQPPLHPRRMNFFRKSFDFSMETARAALGYAPGIDFRTGAARTADWYREQDLVP